MNYILLFCLISSMICGIINGISDMNKVRDNPSLGVKESKNLFTYLFLN